MINLFERLFLGEVCFLSPAILVSWRFETSHEDTHGRTAVHVRRVRTKVHSETQHASAQKEAQHQTHREGQHEEGLGREQRRCFQPVRHRSEESPATVHVHDFRRQPNVQNPRQDLAANCDARGDRRRCAEQSGDFQSVRATQQPHWTNGEHQRR